MLLKIQIKTHLRYFGDLPRCIQMLLAGLISYCRNIVVYASETFR